MNKELKEYAEMMEMKTNKASQDLIHMIRKQGLDPQAAIISILKASAIILESYASIGGNADLLEKMMKEMIGPAREEAKRIMSHVKMSDNLNN
jgi:hypothetical protein